MTERESLLYRRLGSVLTQLSAADKEVDLMSSSHAEAAIQRLIWAVDDLARGLAELIGQKLDEDES